MSSKLEPISPQSFPLAAGNPLMTQTQRPLSERHQELKFMLHRKLLDKINLDALATVESDTLRS